MLKSIITFHKGLLKMGPFVLIWIGLLVSMNLIIPLVHFWPRSEAIIAVSVFLAGFMMLILLTHFYGFTRILGLGHILWIPLVIYFLFHTDFSSLEQPLNQWMAGTILCNSISLVIDINDVIQYLRGDRTPLTE